MTIFSQQMDHTCGAACVRTVMAYFGKRVLSEKTLARTLGAKFKTGIEPFQIERYLRQQGLQAEYREEKNVPALLRRRLDGWLPIVCWADWGGHYCVVIGDCWRKDLLGKAIQGLELGDPAAVYEASMDGVTWTSIERFKSMWYTPGQRKKHEVIYVHSS